METNCTSKRWPRTASPCGGAFCAPNLTATAGIRRKRRWMYGCFGRGCGSQRKTAMPKACSPKRRGRACISQRSPLHPAAFRAGARPGSTGPLRHWPESGGYGCAFRPAPGCTSGCGPFCGGAGCGWVFYCSFPCWSGHRILSGPWMQAA